MTDSESRQKSYRNNYYNNRGGSKSQYGYNNNRYQYENDSDDSSEDEPYWQNGYSYRGYNNQKYKKRYYNNYGGYYKKWY